MKEKIKKKHRWRARLLEARFKLFLQLQDGGKHKTRAASYTHPFWRFVQGYGVYSAVDMVQHLLVCFLFVYSLDLTMSQDWPQTLTPTSASSACMCHHAQLQP